MPTALTWFLILFPPPGYGQFKMLDPNEGVVFRTASKENCELRLKAARNRMKQIKEETGLVGFALCVSADAPEAQ